MLAPVIEIRAATVDDADAICDAHVAAWRVAYGDVFPSSVLYGADFEPVRRAFWRRWRFAAGAHTIVPLVDGHVVGFCSFGPERQRPGTIGIRGEVWGLYLHPDAWGSGAGPLLIADAEERLASDGFLEAVLWVLEANRRARSFYEKSGWATTGASAEFDRYPDAHVPEMQYRKKL
jgi:GNAT superfamily N-acetyltransferase